MTLPESLEYIRANKHRTDSVQWQGVTVNNVGRTLRSLEPTLSGGKAVRVASLRIIGKILANSK